MATLWYLVVLVQAVLMAGGLCFPPGAAQEMLHDVSPRLLDLLQSLDATVKQHAKQEKNVWMTEDHASPNMTEDHASPNMTEDHASPNMTEDHASPNMTEDHASPNMTEDHASPNMTEDHASPNMTEDHGGIQVLLAAGSC
ncbi:uncharacterized protein LOC144005367 [Festucalex cinctus]